MEGDGYSHDKSRYLDYSTLKHYPGICKIGEPAVVEIHRIPVPIEYADQFSTKMIFRDKKAVARKPGLYVPSDAHMLLHTFIHSQLAHLGHAYKQSSFRGFNDLFLLSKRIQVFPLPCHTKYTKKAISWLVFGQRVFGLPGLFCPFETREAKWFCMKYDLALRFIKFYNAYTFIKKLINVLFVRYAGTLLKAIFLERQRMYVYRRLKDPKWYGAHLMSFKDF